MIGHNSPDANIVGKLLQLLIATKNPVRYIFKIHTSTTAVITVQNQSQSQDQSSSKPNPYYYMHVHGEPSDMERCCTMFELTTYMHAVEIIYARTNVLCIPNQLIKWH